MTESSQVSRRYFLRAASIGAAGGAALAAGGTSVLLSATGAEASTIPAAVPVTGDVPTSKATDVFVHVSDVSRGEITIFHGTEAYSITDTGLAQALARAIVR